MRNAHVSLSRQIEYISLLDQHAVHFLFRIAVNHMNIALKRVLWAVVLGGSRLFAQLVTHR